MSGLPKTDKEPPPSDSTQRRKKCSVKGAQFGAGKIKNIKTWKKSLIIGIGPLDCKP